MPMSDAAQDFITHLAFSLWWILLQICSGVVILLEPITADFGTTLGHVTATFEISNFYFVWVYNNAQEIIYLDKLI